MRFCRIMLQLVAVAAISIGMCYAQKTTVDPNTLAPKVVESDGVDARLSQKITYEVWHKPLKTILAELSEKTGVTFKAGVNEKDWQVRDRTMNIYVKDVTLRQLINSIARTMKFKWSKNENAVPVTYRLYADRIMLAKLQAEASRLQDEFRKEELKRRTRTVDELANIADLSGEKLEALRKDNPYLYQCASTGFAKAMTQVFADEPGLRQAFINGNNSIAVDVNHFSSSTQYLLTEAVRKCWPLDSVTQDVPPIGDDFEEDISKGSLALDWIARPLTGNKLFYFGPMCIHTPKGGHFLGDLRDPYSESSKAWGNACLSAVERNLPPGKNWSQVAPDYFPVEAEQRKENEPYLMFDPVAEHPDDPALHKEVNLVISDETMKSIAEEARKSGYRTIVRLYYQMILKAIVEAADLSIVSDSYSSTLCYNLQLPEKGELIVVLDKITEAYKTNWEKQGSILEFRRRDWFKMRASQLPDEWLQPWREEVEKNGILTLDSYADMVSLTEDQIEENINSDSLLGQVVGDTRRARPFCRFYAQLNDSQRKSVLSGSGLDMRLLKPMQWQYYSDIYEYGWQSRWNSAEFINPDRGTVAIRGVDESKGGGSGNYRFTAFLTREDGSTDQQEWRINLPRVSKPKDQSQAGSGK